jgi:hypothetical protein
MAHFQYVLFYCLHMLDIRDARRNAWKRVMRLARLWMVMSAYRITSPLAQVMSP